MATQRVPLTQYQQVSTSQSPENAYSGFHTILRPQNEGQPSGLSSGITSGLRENEQVQSIRNIPMDPELVNQIYQIYVQLLAQDKNAKIKDVLVQEPYLSLM